MDHLAEAKQHEKKASGDPYVWYAAIHALIAIAEELRRFNDRTEHDACDHEMAASAKAVRELYPLKVADW